MPLPCHPIAPRLPKRHTPPAMWLLLVPLLGGCVRVVVPEPDPAVTSAAAAGAALGGMLGAALDAAAYPGYPPPTYPPPTHPPSAGPAAPWGGAKSP
ncbi:hypothetical protein M0638_05385 [Roseomonas sp. NAR14]|uniref:Uncharacterized protein n=1 Tax=Roseomonas acroporae TaxID=2937791 RepID=A0A9X1Y5H2_9PROT|nr:hypothetical protein [Roseomonas acroporae]MCK8783813.1 hypothetical protein [Roseomonas acroporae]